jgi:hypothetical protein
MEYSTMIDERIRVNIKKIRERTRIIPELRNKPHHFLYDKRYTDATRIQYFVMGINPGEPKTEKNPRGDDFPREETSLSDFIKEGKESLPARKYRETCHYICGTPDIALTEMLFWSSLDVRQLEERYAARNEHARWCAPLNKGLIAIHNPRAVLCFGIGHMLDFKELYGLTEAGDPVLFTKVWKKGQRVGRLIVPFKDGSGRKWLILKHISRFLTTPEKKRIREYVERET